MSHPKKTLPRIECSGVSHIGPVREDNQDAIRLSEDHTARERGFLYAVADGMGGYAHGQIASTLAVEKLFQSFFGGRALPAIRALSRGVQSANLEVYRTAQRFGAGRMGTTLTAASVIGNQLYLAHIGDSRAYLIRDHRAVCLTDDHTTVGDLVRVRVLSPDKVRTHAQRSILTKAIGLQLFVKPDLTQHALKEGDCVILCSDGVWSVIEDHEFATVASQTNGARDLSHTLIYLALERRTDDNVSVVTIKVQDLPSPAENGHERQHWLASIRGWFSKCQLNPPESAPAYRSK